MSQTEGMDDNIKQTNNDDVENEQSVMENQATVTAMVDGNTGEMSDKGKTEEASGVRPKTFSEKAKQYELNKAEKMFQKLKRTSDKIRNMVDKKVSFDTVRTHHSTWMQMYETFLKHHQSISPRIPKTDKDDYLTTFTERDEALQDFNNFIGEYFNSATAKKEQENITAKRSIKSRNSTKSVSTMSSKTESSYQSSKTRTSQSTRSGISSQKLKEETKQAELKAKILAFEKKKELEIAKTQIKLEEEELKLKTDIAISDAKTQILNKYENQTASNIGSEYANSIVGQKLQEPHFHNDSTYTREVQNRETPNGLNVNATPYVPRGRVKVPNPVKTVVHFNSNADSQDNHNDMISVVKHLRKPASDIRKFGGDPLEFRKFIRQFNARIVINAESEDEKMTYLEQYTYGEAHKVVSGYGQLNADYAYSSAIKQLHERYSNEEVIANAFIKKALEWPDIQPNDAKALDEFSLFLIECKNAIESMEAIRILEYSENIKLLMQKLPLYLHDRWRNIVLSIRDRHESVK